jgi:hypothetical protein
MTQANIVLPSGRLGITVASEDLPLDTLCDFAARHNARRGFLIVSRVLGRHLPTRPSVMAHSYTLCARRLEAAGPLAGPVLFVGLAETATGLGQGIHDALCALSGRDDAGFLHSSRQRLPCPPLLTFQEPHSHAAAHLLYPPSGAGIDLAATRTLVLIDDEASTGTSLCNLAHALAAHMPQLRQILCVMLTDWTGKDDWLAAMPKPARAISLLSGTLAWTAEGTPPPPPAAAPDSHAFGTLACDPGLGRLGVTGPIAPRVLARCQPWLDQLPAGQRLRVLGTGEFVHAPWVLASALEAQGHDVLFQATSRSPVQIGGAIDSRLVFADNYGAPVPNYLYNVDLADGRQTIICHETPPGSIDPALVAALDAQTLYMGAAT